MNTISQKMAVGLGALYTCALLGILLWPSPVDRPIDGSISHAIQWLHAHGVPSWLVNYGIVEFTANIVLFVPLGVILTLRLPRRRWPLTVLIAAAMSATFELAQGIFLASRVPDLSDVIANTTGAFIGSVLVLLCWFLRQRRSLHTEICPA